MTRFRIREQQQLVTVELTDVGHQQTDLLEAFQECQEGRCDCPTDEYQKVSGMAVESGEDQIQIRLEAKPGEHFDTGAIATCLDRTISKGRKAAADVSADARSLGRASPLFENPKEDTKGNAGTLEDRDTAGSGREALGRQ